MTGLENSRDLLRHRVWASGGGVWPSSSPTLSNAPNLLLKWQGLTSLFQVGLQALLSALTSFPFLILMQGLGG